MLQHHAYILLHCTLIWKFKLAMTLIIKVRDKYEASISLTWAWHCSALACFYLFSNIMLGGLRHCMFLFLLSVLACIDYLQICPLFLLGLWVLVVWLSISFITFGCPTTSCFLVFSLPILGILSWYTHLESLVVFWCGCCLAPAMSAHCLLVLLHFGFVFIYRFYSRKESY